MLIKIGTEKMLFIQLQLSISILLMSIWWLSALHCTYKYLISKKSLDRHIFYLIDRERRKKNIAEQQTSTFAPLPCEIFEHNTCV